MNCGDILRVHNKNWVPACAGMSGVVQGCRCPVGMQLPAGAGLAAPVSAIATRGLAQAAQAIALELDRSAYDSLYLAAAFAERAVLVTADAAFAEAAMAHPVYGASVRLL